MEAFNNNISGIARTWQSMAVATPICQNNLLRALASFFPPWTLLSIGLHYNHRLPTTCPLTCNPQIKFNMTSKLSHFYSVTSNHTSRDFDCDTSTPSTSGSSTTSSTGSSSHSTSSSSSSIHVPSTPPSWPSYNRTNVFSFSRIHITVCMLDYQ